MKKILSALFLIILFSQSYAQLSISFGDNPEKVHNVLKIITNQINSENGEIYAYTKPNYENGRIVEIWHVKKNLTNLYGTLTRSFTAKERFVFKNNELAERYVEIPEKSLSEVKKTIGNSNQFKFVDSYIFSENYESVYSVFLNSDKIATVQALPTNSQKFPTKVQKEIDSIFQAKVDEDTKKQKENELYEQQQKENAEKESTKTMVAIAKDAEFSGVQSAMNKYISKNLEIPDDAKNWSGKVLVKFVIDKDGSVQDVNVQDLRNSERLPTSLKYSIISTFKKMPKWKPAELGDGAPVRSSKIMPLTL